VGGLGPGPPGPPLNPALLIQTYTAPVLLKDRKLAREHSRLYGYFYGVDPCSSHQLLVNLSSARRTFAGDLVSVAAGV